ncbi:epoxide hydrolase family protein [Silvibacterium acidisoli]|uniref:epoxide hydrolase family protein n=1 Tax=Acidobacteriaceae bacterium ZG23-2 TaxID=2883246 RepID=UPI00406CC575
MQKLNIHLPETVLEDLRLRLHHTRWPDHVPGIGWKQGTDPAWIQSLVAYWAAEFDWRGWEQRLNALDHFSWEGIHFVHRRAASGHGMPLLLTHGWPGSFLDYLGLLPMLDEFDVVIPSLPGYGFSPRPARTGINYRFVAERWHRLMSALGYARYGAAGYDFGAGVTTLLAAGHPASVFGIHLTTLESDLTPEVDDAELSASEAEYLAVNRAWDTTERGYSAIQSTKPQTIGYGLNDSPAGLAAYLGEKWHSWSDVTPSHDFLCATFTLYWATQTITSSMRDYWDNRCFPAGRVAVDTPTAFGVFAHQTVPEGDPPRSWLERVYNIQRWTVFPRGGHFAPVEEPALLAADMAEFFRGFR